jgi:Flp pilus assembly protein TadG
MTERMRATGGPGKGDATMMDTFMKGCRAIARGGFLRRLIGDRKGVAAVEFALIAPVLLTLYFVTMEVAQAIETNKKISRVASMVADLVTQQQSINRQEIDAIMTIGETILVPYNRSQPVIDITAIEVTDDNNPRAEVMWSRRLSNGGTGIGSPVGSTAQIPESLRIPGSFLIRVSGQLNYRPVISWTAEQRSSLGLLGAFDQIRMNETYFLRPRMSRDIGCDDC